MRARDNPFATWRVEQLRYQFPDRTWEQFMQEVRAANYRGALVGPEGSGKTTLLEDLEQRLSSWGVSTLTLQLTQERRTLSKDDWRNIQRHPDCVLLLDGAEQLSPAGWWTFRYRVRAARGLIITVHKPGRLPTLLSCRTSPELLAGLVARLATDFSLSSEEIHQLYHRHRGNLRDALRELYDRQNMAVE